MARIKRTVREKIEFSPQNVLRRAKAELARFNGAAYRRVYVHDLETLVDIAETYFCDCALKDRSP